MGETPETNFIEMIEAALKAEVDKGKEVKKVVEILKEGTNEEKRLVMGIVLKPDVPDGHGDVMKGNDIEWTAHNFLISYREVGDQHEKAADAVVVESYIAPVDMDINGRTVKKGSWVLVVKVFSDGLWFKIKSGHLNAFSAGGFAKRTPLE